MLDPSTWEAPDLSRSSPQSPSCENHRMSAASPDVPDDDLALLPADLAQLGTAPPEAPSAGRIALGAGSMVLVLALLAWALPWASGASWAEILERLGALPGWALPAAAALGAGALFLETLTVRAALPGARVGAALQGHASSQAIALGVPGGTMIGMGAMAWILRRSGLALPLVLTGLLLASLVEMVVTSVLVPVLGLASYALASILGAAPVELPGTLWAAALALVGALAALAAVALVLRRDVLARLLVALRVGIPQEVGLVILRQRDALVDLLRRRPLALLLPTLGARVLQWLALVLAVEAVGAEVPLLLTVAIFALGRLLALVPLTPGGAGITESVGAAALVGLGVAPAEAATAMLVLLVTMLIVPLLAGIPATALAFAGPRRRAGSR